MSCGFMFPPDPNNSLDLDLSNRQTMLSLDILEAQVQCWFFSYVSIVFLLFLDAVQTIWTSLPIGTV